MPNDVAAEPAASDFAKWDFEEGERFPVEWIQAGYGDASLFQPPNDRTYRALWLANGLWRLRWYRSQPGELGRLFDGDSTSMQVTNRCSGPAS